jgi:hypothetical protein
MNAIMTGYVLAIDIGAGQSTKIALFDGPHRIVEEVELPLGHYGTTFESYAAQLETRIDAILASHSNIAVGAIGIASAGILNSDGSFLLVQNLQFLCGHNLKRRLEERYSIPVGIDNDANAGGLAEWSLLRVELLYWVFGGGWGGVWISRDGAVRYPSNDWTGKDGDLHPTNEPGYSIPLEKLMLRQVFLEVNASYERFEYALLEEFGGDPAQIHGPDGDPDSLRAEVILSGPGRCRLFRAVVGDDDFYQRFLDIHEAREIADPSVAGRHISKLSSMRVEAAINTDRLYGKILAVATRYLLRRAGRDGLSQGVPICLGGKPSYALPYFGPSAQRFLGKFGFMNYMRPSVIDERGLNANLVGAAVLAYQTATGGLRPTG